MDKLLFSLLTFLAFSLLLSCKGPKEPAIDQETFPGPGAQLTGKQTGSLVFNWGRELQARMPSPAKQVFRLYQLDSMGQSIESVVYLKVLQEEILSDAYFTTAKVDLQGGGATSQIYVWEVLDEYEKPIKKPSSFVVGETSDLSQLVASLYTAPCTNCDRKPGASGNCDEVVCRFCPDGNIHIVTLTDFDIMGGEALRFGSRNVDTLNSVPCLRAIEDDVNQINASFTVSVPCDSLPTVETSQIRVFLYKNGTLLREEDQNNLGLENQYDYSLQLTLNDTKVFNDTSIQSSDMTIAQDDYIAFCEGLTGESLVCKVTVDLELFLLVYDVDVNDTYTLVFFLPAYEEHSHGTYPATDTQPRGRTPKVKQPPIAHTHGDLNISCTDAHLDKTSLAYFECLNADTSHIAQHVVVTSMAICQ